MARNPWYKALFERDYYDYFYVGGPRGRFTDEEIARRTDGQVDFIVRALAPPEGAWPDARPSGRILDLCCGWGRHAVRLAQRGFDVTGLDLSAYHLRLAKAAAREAGVVVDWRRADMREIPRDAGRFAAVINCFTSFGYFDDEADDQRVLAGVRRALKPGGRFFIDTMNRDWLMRVFRESEWSERPDGGVNLERRYFDAKTGRIENEWVYVTAEGERRTQAFSHRLYTFTELAAMLSRAGLTVLEAWGGFDGSEYNMYSPRMVVLAERS